VGVYVLTVPDSLAIGCYIVKLMRGNAVVIYDKLLVK
jgi:hypothetical protein